MMATWSVVAMGKVFPITELIIVTTAKLCGLLIFGNAEMR